MKKNGFTLAEVLISMAIIGIVASLTAPTLVNIMPNKDKMQTIKYQKLVSEINADLLSNRTLYPEGAWDTSSLEHIPEYGALLKGDDITKWNLLQTNKYAYLLTEKLEVDSSVQASSNEVNFTTADGCQWKVTTSGGRPTSILIDTNGADEPNAYGKSNLKYPDKFSFLVNKETNAVECDPNVDPITCRYLRCPYYMNNRKLDYECMNSYSGGCACD